MNRFPEDDQRLKSLILHIAGVLGEAEEFDRAGLGRLLFQSDFSHFRRFGFPITGQTYERGIQGPVPRNLGRVLAEMEAAFEIETWEHPLQDGLHVQYRVRALREPALREFDGQEIALVDELLRDFSGLRNSPDTSRIGRVEGWRHAGLKEEIPYGVALVGDLENKRDIGDINDSAGFLESPEDTQSDAPRLDEFLEGARWLLAREQQSGLPDTEDPEMRVLISGNIPGHPVMAIRYSSGWEGIRLISLALVTGPGYPTPGRRRIPLSESGQESEAILIPMQSK